MGQIHPNRERTHADIAADLHLSRSRIHKAEQTALRKIVRCAVANPREFPRLAEMASRAPRKYQ